MAMMPDVLKFLTDRLGLQPTQDTMERSPSELGADTADSGVMNADKMREARTQDNSNVIYNDSGKAVDYSNGNPFANISNMISKSRSDDDKGPGMLRQLLFGVLGGGLVPGMPKVGGGDPSVVPGQGQDAALNPMPLTRQRQSKLMRDMPGAPDPNFPLENTTTVAKDYSQPTALDPQSIEELRLSLMTQAGQYDPNNPNGLAGRMSGPYAKPDQRSQMDDAQIQADELNAKKSSMRADARNVKR